MGRVISERIRDGFFSSNRMAWSCRSSVMEMTKNKITRPQPMATIFRQELAECREDAAALDSMTTCAKIPAMATQTQTRLRVSSIG